jgi:hypothetical protein
VERERSVERKNRRGNEVGRGRERNGTRRIIKAIGKSTNREAEGSSEQQWLKWRCVFS